MVKCQVCGQRFTSTHALGGHMKIHNNKSRKSKSSSNKNKKEKPNLDKNYPLSFIIKMIRKIELFEQKNPYTKVPWREFVRNNFEKYHTDGILNDDVIALRSKVRLLQKWCENKKKYLDKSKNSTHNNNIESKKKHQCPICKKVFSNGSALGGHRSGNKICGYDVKQYNHECKVCGKLFNSGAALGGHKKIHNSKIYDSDYTSPDDNELNIIISEIDTSDVETSDIDVDIPDIDTGMETNTDDNNDIETDNDMDNNSTDNDGLYNCSECHKYFGSYKSLSSHKAAHSKRKHECKVCGKVFDSGMGLGGHMSRAHKLPDKKEPKVPQGLTKEVTIDAEYECQLFGCQEQFQYKFQYLYHLENHPKFELINCDVCNQLFSSKYKLITHKINYHNESDKNT